MRKKDIHVLPTGDSWVVRSAEVNEASFNSIYDAETFGRRVAREEKCNFFLHGLDGSIQKSDSYAGAESYPQ